MLGKGSFFFPVSWDQHRTSLGYMTRQLQLLECYSFYEKYPTQFMSLGIRMTANIVLEDCETFWQGNTLADSYHKHGPKGLYNAGFRSSSLFQDQPTKIGLGSASTGTFPVTVLSSQWQTLHPKTMRQNKPFLFQVSSRRYFSIARREAAVAGGRGKLKAVYLLSLRRILMS